MKTKKEIERLKKAWLAAKDAAMAAVVTWAAWAEYQKTLKGEK